MIVAGQQFVFSVAKSHNHILVWVFDVGADYTALMVQEFIEDILGDYNYANIAINFVRSHGDVRFVPLQEWLQSLGLRYHVWPPGYHGTIIERFIRAIKKISRTILHGLEYRMPIHHIQYLIQEAVRLISIRYDE